MTKRDTFELPGDRARLFSRLLETIEFEVVPLTTRGVARRATRFSAPLFCGNRT